MPAGGPWSDRALEEAMDAVEKRAKPWRVTPDDRTRLRNKFQEDFDELINDKADYNYWIHLIKRLFNHVGARAAYSAEAWFQDVSQTATEVTLDELFTACHLVRVDICPGPREKENGEDEEKENGENEHRICRTAFDADGKDLDQIKRRGESLRDLLRLKSGRPPLPGK